MLAVTGFGVGAVLFVWAVGALLGGDTTSSVQGPVNLRAGVRMTSNAPSSDPPRTGRLTMPGASSSSPPTAPMTTSRTTTTTTVQTTTTPAVPQACPDSVIRVTITSDRSSYPVGSHPVLTLHVANAGPVACVRDVSHQLRTIQVLPAGRTTPVWASDDCYSITTHEVRTLQPEQSLDYNVTWAGRTAAPGCAAHRATVPAGTYELVGRLGNLTGPPTPLTFG
jgi:hypothetical protein